ncbi:MAG: hypothetical protein ABEL97_11000 [Salinibacter sp.]
MADSGPDLPRGLVFQPRRSPRRWVTVLAVLAVVCLAGAALVWPVYSLVPPLEPYVLGLPFSFAWVVGWLGVVFGALLVLYRTDDRPDAE